jgi:hypothetical protein
MTVAMQEAVALGAALKKEPDTVQAASRAMRGFDKLLPTAWEFATSEDYRFATTEGPPITGKIRFAHRYLDHVFEIATRDEQVARTFTRVIHCLEPGEAVFKPHVFLPVLWQVLRGFNPRREMERALAAANLPQLTPASDS